MGHGSNTDQTRIKTSEIAALLAPCLSVFHPWPKVPPSTDSFLARILAIFEKRIQKSSQVAARK
jgi:hypothetical protein